MNYKEFAQALKTGSVGGAYLFEGVEENIKDERIVLKMNLPPGNLIFANAYAHIDAINKWPKVPITVVNTVLKM